MTGAVPGPDKRCRRIRVAVVDDSVVVRALFARWLAECADIEIVGVHRNGLEALRQIAASQPDVVLLDIEMPDMDGLTALPLLREAAPACRVLIVSHLSLRGADVSLRCLLRGASDCLPKPSTLDGSDAVEQFRTDMIGLVRGIGTAPQVVAPDALIRTAGAPARTGRRAEVLVIGASTGGPQAVTDLLEASRALLPQLTVVVAQHMPRVFTRLFAEHLRRSSGIEAIEISDGDRLRPGVVHVCRGGDLLAMCREASDLRIRARTGAVGERRGPSVDVMLASAAEVCGAAAVGVILTGVGDDGARGAEALAAAGGTVLAQDAATSVIWGMPGAAVATGAVSMVGDVAELARHLAGLVAPAQPVQSGRKGFKPMS